jgi:putative SOS response-associated peptidase YedK
LVGRCAARAKLEGDISQIKIAFRVPPDYPTPNFAPSWNVAPTDNLPIVRYNPKAGHRTLDLMRWGLIPYWAKDIKIGFSTINAMAETVDSGHDPSIFVRAAVPFPRYKRGRQRKATTRS